MAVGAAVGRADLLRIYLERGEVELATLAGRLGFEPRFPVGAEDVPVTSGKQVPTPGLEPITAPTRYQRSLFWRPVAIEWVEAEVEEPEPPAEDELTVADSRPPDLAPPQPAPITPWPRLRRRLDPALRTTQSSHEVDTDALIRRWSRGEVVHEIPRRPGFSHARVALILDDSPRLTPFRDDQFGVAAALLRTLAPGMLRLLPPAREAGHEPVAPPAEDEVVLALTDLGAYGGQAVQQGWERYGRVLGDRRTRLVALTLSPSHRWPRAASAWSAIDWSTPAAAMRARVGTPKRAKAVERLLAAIAPTLRVEPGLLRELRRLVGPPADLGTEADVWNHPQVEGGAGVAIAVDPERSPAWQRRFGAFEEELMAAIARAILRWHRGLPWEIRAVEIAQLQAAGVPAEVLGVEEVEKAEEWFRRAALTLEARSPEGSALGSGLDRYLQRTTHRGSQTVWSVPGYRSALAHIVRTLRDRYADLQLPVGVTPEMFPRPDPHLPSRRFTVWQNGNELRVHLPDETGKGSPLVTVVGRALRLAVLGGDRPAVEVHLAGTERHTLWPPGETPVTLVTDLETVTLDRIERPEWAVAAGRDRFGLWAEFEVAGVRQRLRWLSPGRFWMGSPQDEEGRCDDEGPQHPVELTSGFWLADTPCTQELYAAVTGKNPSRFRSPRRPAEQVSWEDCQELFAWLEKHVPQLSARLPTEAEWEYACRAGIETAKWAEDASLESLAWYSKNSKKTTWEVGLKPANPWGLYDMLGNVYEWCLDWEGDYPAIRAVDPLGPETGTGRVVRGGSWDSDAQGVRAASRNWSSPSGRLSDLGFRLARGQGRGAKRRGVKGR